MSALSDRRAHLVGLVEHLPAQVFDHVPEMLQPPAILVLSGSPYIEPGDVYGSVLVRHVLTVVVPQAANDRQLDELDALTEDVVVGLINARESLDSVSPPYALAFPSAQFLAADITVTAIVHL